MKCHRIGILFLSVAGLGCPPGAFPGAGGPPTGGTSGGEMGAQCSADFGATAAAEKLETFLLATSTFVGTAAELQADILNSCRDMGRELGLSDAELQGQGQGPEVKGVCDVVAAKIRAEMTDLRAQANLRISVVAEPPRCEVRMDAYAQCAGQCDATVDPGKVDIQCEGGEIVGKCDAQCQGSCVVEGSAKCSGACKGTCSGGCSGTCQGVCEGTCASQGSDGQCNGRCNGTCRGTCSAGCSGTCSGSCEVKGQASCQGECHGGCSVAYKEPRCTGTVRPPKVDAQCKASCDAKLNAEAKCEPGYTEVVITGDLSTNVKERAQRLQAALRGGLAGIRAAGAKLQRLGASGKAMLQAGKGLPRAVGTLGLQAGACATQALAALPRATASVAVSIEVSASVSASAGAG